MNILRETAVTHSEAVVFSVSRENFQSKLEVVHWAEDG